MTARPPVPNFGALLRPHIASVPPEGRPAYLAGLERSAAARYRRWADERPGHRAELLASAAREDEIADLVATLYPVSPVVQHDIDDSLGPAIDLYYDVFESYPIDDQLYLQSEAELQGAQAWRAMAATARDDHARDVLLRCAALEEESSVVVNRLLDA